MPHSYSVALLTGAKTGLKRVSVSYECLRQQTPTLSPRVSSGVVIRIDVFTHCCMVYKFHKSQLALKPRELSALFLGWFLISLAISLLIKADLGVAPFDVLNTAISSRAGVSVGVATWVSAAGLLALAWVLGAKPGVGTLVGPLFIGAGIDLLSPLVPHSNLLLLRFVTVISALFILYPGVCLVLLSRLGAGPTEVLMTAVTKRGLSITKARWCIESACLAVGVFLGGSFGLVTVLVVLSAGPLIAALLKPIARLARLDPL